MKTAVHPKYFASVEIKCSCGHITLAGSTKENLRTELCSNCHPFYTGQQKLVDTAGRVDKFQAKRKKAETIKAEVKERAATRKKPVMYKEKEVPQEVIEKSMGKQAKAEKSKWGGPLGDAPAVEVAKEDAAKAEQESK